MLNLLSPLVLRLAGIALAVALVLGALGYVSHLRNENARLTEANAVLKSVAEQNARAALEAKAAADKAVAAVTADRDRALKRASTLQSTLGKIHAAPSTDDGAVAPVLAGELSRLRDARSGSGHPDRKD